MPVCAGICLLHSDVIDMLICELVMCDWNVVINDMLELSNPCLLCEMHV
jgi:hypothetical protein